VAIIEGGTDLKRFDYRTNLNAQFFNEATMTGAGVQSDFYVHSPIVSMALTSSKLVGWFSPSFRVSFSSIVAGEITEIWRGSWRFNA
jgi:hypothetical protein